MYSVESVTEKIFDLLPKGEVFKTLASDSNWCKLLSGIAEEYTRVLNSAINTVYEAIPTIAYETIFDRYAEAGLPSSCNKVPAVTIEDKRTEILEVWTNIGDCTKQGILDVLTKLGVQASITETYAGLKGLSCISTCDCYVLDESNVFTWTINYVDSEIKLFTVGKSTAGEYLGSAGTVINKFQCYINKIKPAHTTVIFNAVTSL